MLKDISTKNYIYIVIKVSNLVVQIGHCVALLTLSSIDTHFGASTTGSF